MLQIFYEHSRLVESYTYLQKCVKNIQRHEHNTPFSSPLTVPNTIDLYFKTNFNLKNTYCKSALYMISLMAVFSGDITVYNHKNTSKSEI
jgi:hypothetical protein